MTEISESIADLMQEIATVDVGPRVALSVRSELDRIQAAIRTDASDTQYQPDMIGPRCEALFEATKGLVAIGGAVGYWGPVSTIRLWDGLFAALVPGRQDGWCRGRLEPARDLSCGPGRI